MSRPQLPHLRSRLRRGRWFHTYRTPDGKEISLGVHGLHPSDPAVTAAWAAEHARQTARPPGVTTPKGGTFAWAVDVYRTSEHWRRKLRASTRKNRDAIFVRYIETQGERPVASITRDMLKAGLKARGGHAAANELKALRPVFIHLTNLGLIPTDPTEGLVAKRPTSNGFPQITAEEIAMFQDHWAIGTTERLIFDLGTLTGAARADLARLGRKNVGASVLTYARIKTGVEAHIPLTRELRAVIARTPDIAPAFILNKYGRPFTAESLGNLFAEAAAAAGINSRLHGLRKGFCAYWAEQGRSTSEIAAMSGHLTLAEVDLYTRGAERKRMVERLAEAE